jgi:hypothetical protein
MGSAQKQASTLMINNLEMDTDEHNPLNTPNPVQQNSVEEPIVAISADVGTESEDEDTEEEEVLAVFAPVKPDVEELSSKHEVDVVIEIINTETVDTGFKKHVKYTIGGQDKQGLYTVKRRYKEFFALHNQLVLNWPGCYVPLIPPKVTFGNKKADVVAFRRKLLEEFLRKSSMIGFLYQSPEY